MAKKKISFDIDEIDFQKIKIILQKNPNLGQGEFLREAVKQMISSYDEESMTIYIPWNGAIETFTINTKNFNIEFFEASSDMKEIVGAKKEGVIKNLDNFKLNSKLSKLIENSFNKKIAFFVK